MPLRIRSQGLSSLRRPKRVVLQPAKVKRHPMLDAIRRKYSSQTTLNSQIAKAKATDPVGMLRYQRRINNSAPTTTKIIDSKYQRSLYKPIV